MCDKDLCHASTQAVVNGKVTLLICFAEKDAHPFSADDPEQKVHLDPLVNVGWLA